MTSVPFDPNYDFISVKDALTLTHRIWRVSLVTSKSDKQKVKADDNDGRDFVELPISPPVKLPLPPPEPPEPPEPPSADH